jgi:REP element-mobilizing transposase RayT
MARRKIPFLPNNYYHIYNRGANRADIFLNDRDYIFLLKQLKDHIKEFDITMIVYCLMSNHYHFILRQNGLAKISDFMQAVFYIYSSAFNTIHKRSGTLFEGPFRAILIDKTEYLLHLCRYIHRNPLEAGIVVRPEQWQYSNYPEFIGTRNGDLVDREFVKMNFGSPEEYQEFVMNYVPPEKIQNELRHFLFWD